MDGASIGDTYGTVRSHCRCDYNRANYTVLAINCVLLLLSIIYFGRAQNAIISKHNSAGYFCRLQIDIVSPADVRCRGSPCRNISEI